ncbi:T-lymphocyte surface antigen Ly-9 isoform X2 [Castor canadensis]|uniref:T-lymphocyte surface antigen Ly-9 isoform X2 n=1 Tax=Castor canadensis TaxID=51338 RepID=A0A8B7VE46_CASCN
MVGPKKQTASWTLESFSEKPQKRQLQILSSFLWILFFLLIGLAASGKDSSPTVMSGILGGSVTFPLNLSMDTEIEDITWIGPQNVLVFARPKGDVSLLAKSYQGRLNITSWNYSLYISNLTWDDAGSFKAQINQKNSKHTTEKKFILNIYEHLQEPQVIMKSMNTSGNTSCSITLMCSVKGAEKDVQYSWTPKDYSSSESYVGSTLTISPNPCDPDLIYTCTAQNPVSQSRSQPVQIWQFCTGDSRGKPMGETVRGTVGEPIILPLALRASKDTEKIVWISNTTIISKRWEEADPPIKPKGPEEDRVQISDQDYSLKISQLKMEDAGLYHACVCSEASRVTSMRHINLHPYRRLKEPNVTSSSIHMEDNICRVNLTCSVEDGGKDVIYIWTYLQKEAVVSQEGSQLNVSWKSGESHPNFTCTASNPVSNSSSQFFSKNICSGSTAVFNSNQAEAPADTQADHTIYTLVSQGYEKPDILPRPTSDTSSDSNVTMEEDEQNTEIDSTANGRDEVYDLATQEDTGDDLASEVQTQYDVITPDDTVVDCEDEGQPEYVQLFCTLQKKTPSPQKKDTSFTVYCSVQRPQKAVPLLQQDDPESSEIPTYENFT